jgi:hypothetical protein
MKWVRVTRKSPCPVCGKPDYCGVSEDRSLVHCMRVESNRPCRSAKIGGWFHQLDEPVKYLPLSRPEPKKVAQKDFVPLAEKCRCALLALPDGIRGLSQELGLSVEYLEAAEAGWSIEYGGYTFPMFDGHRHIIGLQLRTPHGKRSVPGSHGGLFWPKGVSARGKDLLLLPEGATSCGACFDLGYGAIGRFNCEARIDLLQELLAQGRRDVVIVADHDEPHYRPDGSVYYPGQEGAAKVAHEVRPLCKTLKIVKCPSCKDMRDWLHAGATRPVVDCIIHSTKFFEPPELERFL